VVVFQWFVCGLGFSWGGFCMRCLVFRTVRAIFFDFVAFKVCSIF